MKNGKTNNLILKVSTSGDAIGMVSGKIEKTSGISNIVVKAKNSWNLTYNEDTGVFNIYKAAGSKTDEILDISYSLTNQAQTGTIYIKNIKITTINYELTEKENLSKNVIKKQFDGLSIEEGPSKTIYVKGENFNKNGMIVKAHYNDGSSKAITNYTITDGNNLTIGKTSVTISYTENGVTKTATQGITVVEKLQTTLKEICEKQTEDGTTYISNILPGSTISQILETNGTIKVFKGETQITNTNEKIGTGMKITIEKEGSQKEEYIAIVTGDLNGDSEMNDIDMLRLARYGANLDKTLSGAYLKAGDIYKDGNYADDADLLKIARVLVGLDSL